MEFLIPAIGSPDGCPALGPTAVRTAQIRQELPRLVLALLRQVCSHPQQTRAFCARSPPSQAIAEQAPSRGRGRVVLERLTIPAGSPRPLSCSGGSVRRS